MARSQPRPSATSELALDLCLRHCSDCNGALWAAYRKRRTVATLDGLRRLTLTVRRCEPPGCGRSHQSRRPEAEGAWALPHGEFGLDVIALVGALRYREHRSVPEIH